MVSCKVLLWNRRCLSLLGDTDPEIPIMQAHFKAVISQVALNTYLELPAKSVIVESLSGHKYKFSLNDCLQLWKVPTEARAFWLGPHRLETEIRSYHSKIIDSFTAFRTQQSEGCEEAIRESFGDEYVGLVGIPAGKTTETKSKGKGKKISVSPPDDSSSSDSASSGKIESVLIEAREEKTLHPIYLCTWEGFFPLDCNWVKHKHLSPDALKWLKSEREVMFPGFLEKDFPIYRDGDNTLVCNQITERFARAIPNDVFSALGLGAVPPHGQKEIFLAELIVNDKFPLGKFMDLIMKCTKSI